jgi:capsular polysaccharide biosynthesis protein
VQDINLYHLLNFYAKKWIWIVLLTVLGALIGFTYNQYIQTPLYKSDATLLIVSPDGGKASQDSTLINNYTQLLKSRRVLEPVLKEQGLSMSYDELAGATVTTNEKNTEVIKVSIASKDPQVSKELVDGVVTSFKEAIKALYGRDNTNVVDNASLATEPYNVRTTFLVIVTTLVGLLLSLITLFFMYDVNLTKRMVKAKTANRKQTETKTLTRVQSKKKATRKTIASVLSGAMLPKRKSKAKVPSKVAIAREGFVRSAVTMLVGAKPPTKKRVATSRTKAKANNRKK